jgi:hypothetical protein
MKRMERSDWKISYIVITKLQLEPLKSEGVHSRISSSVFFFQSTNSLCTPGMSKRRPFSSPPAARTKFAVIWSFIGQNCRFYNLNWINVRRSQKNSMIFSIQNVLYTWKYGRQLSTHHSVVWHQVLHYKTKLMEVTLVKWKFISFS